jgi:hypothetical protein
MSWDETSGRLHSNVTGLSSRIFPAFRIKGEPLVGYDIANSQPFLCSALINLLLDNEQKKGNFTHFFQSNPISTPQTSLLTNSSFLSYLKPFIPTKTLSAIVMLEDFLSEPDLTGVIEFQNLCLTGNLYPEIARNVFEFEYEDKNKRRVKDLFFTLFLQNQATTSKAFLYLKSNTLEFIKSFQKLKNSVWIQTFFQCYYSVWNPTIS